MLGPSLLVSPPTESSLIDVKVTFWETVPLAEQIPREMEWSARLALQIHALAEAAEQELVIMFLQEEPEALEGLDP